MKEKTTPNFQALAWEFFDDGCNGSFREFVEKRIKDAANKDEIMKAFDAYIEKIKRDNECSSCPQIKELMEVLSNVIGILQYEEEPDRQQRELLPILNSFYDALTTTEIVSSIRNGIGLPVYGHVAKGDRIVEAIKREETASAFLALCSNRAWYKELGITPQHAFMLKKRVKEGTLSDKIMTDILKKAGWIRE